MTLLTFNGVAMPAPTSYDVSLADIQSANSGRNDNGVMTMDVIRTNVATINVAWEMLTTEELEKITNGIKYPSIEVKYYYGGYKTATMYKGDRKIDLMHVDETDPRWGISFTLIEY
jgi:hypothetical protein